MDKKNLDYFETSFLILITLIIGQLFLIFVNIYYNQSFPIEGFTIVAIQLISILLSYFFGIFAATFFSLVYIVGYIFYIMKSEASIDLGLYILFFFVPLSTIIAGNMKKTRDDLSNNLAKLNKLENLKLKIDPLTNLYNEFAFSDIVSKNSNLANRHSSYFFSVTMFRLEFIGSLKTLLGLKEFNTLMIEIAAIIDNNLREEDYKFIVSNNRFVILNPHSTSEDIQPALKRILETVSRLNVSDRNGEKINLILKIGSLDFTKDKFDLFKDSKLLLVELEKATEVDVYGEYTN